MKNVFQFSCGYRVFSRYWWRNQFRLHVFTNPLVWSYQRVTRGWADCDVWSLDYHLNNWMPDAIEHLRKNTHGHPFNLTPEKWDKILAQIAEGFRANLRLGEAEETEADEKLWKDGMKLFVKWYNALWD